LFGEALEFISLDERRSFQYSGSAETPARSALSLILDGSNGSLSSPINSVSKFDVLECGRVSSGVDLRETIHQVFLDALILSHVCELIDSSLVGLGRVTVDLLYLFPVGK